MFFVYLLKSLKDNGYYIGYSNGLDDRLKYHNRGRVKSTKSRRPWKLIGFEEYKTENEARWREHCLKKSAQARKKLIEKLDKNMGA